MSPRAASVLGPRTEEKEAAARRIVARSASPNTEVRILVVEDDAATRNCLCRLLESFGYTCAEAADGAEALLRVRAFWPQAIVMDCNMPVLDGLEAVRRLKADPVTRAIPVVALTANARREDQRQAGQAGVDAFLTKPTNLSELINNLRSLAPPPASHVG
jgi:CheY-like chemotaxis protein